MKILGIETSCDETAAAIVEDGPSTGSGLRILSNVVASSVELHKKTGGIIPEIAAREQIRCIIPVIQEAITEAFSGQRLASRKKLNASPYSLEAGLIDALAVTIGPGLIGSLLVGVETAKTLSFVWNKPIVPINHLQAHLYANWLDNKNPQFPAIGLVVSGGHTDLVLMKDHGNIKWLGGTRDDAAGECFDKCARLLGLGYPGGPVIAAEAAKLVASRYPLIPRLPRPMIKSDDFDFSFSGLKTAVINQVKDLKSIKQFNNSVIQQLSYEIQESITDVLVEKTIRAAKRYKVKSILLAGGVAANERLGEKFKSSISHSPFSIYQPPPRLCTDNATYVASCAYFNFKPIPWKKIEANPGSSIAEASLDKT